MEMGNTGGERLLYGREHGDGVVAALTLTLLITTVCTQGYLFCTSGYDPMQVYLTAQTVALFASVAFILIG